MCVWGGGGVGWVWGLKGREHYMERMGGDTVCMNETE